MGDGVTGTESGGPIAPNQWRLWVAHELDPGSDAYHISRALRMTGPLDVEALRAALGAVLARHEALRTVFLDRDDDVETRVWSATATLAAVLDVGDGADATATAVRAFCRAPFDLRAAPPLRARLLRITDHDHGLLVTYHHIAVDSLSIGVVERELGEAYAAAACGRGWDPGPATPYSAYARWQRETLDDATREREQEFWRAALPADPPQPSALASAPMRGGTCADAVTVTWPAQASAALRGLCGRFRTTPFAVFQTAVSVLLWRYTGRDPVLGATTLGRARPEFATAVGFFANTIALSTPVGDDPSFATAVARGRRTVLDAMAHSAVPFDQVVRSLSPVAGRGARFDVGVEVRGEGPWGELSWGPLTVTEWDVGPVADHPRNDVTFALMRDGSRHSVLVEYDATLVDRAVAHAAVAALAALVVDGAERPDAPVSQLAMLDPALPPAPAAARPPEPRSFPATSESIRALPAAHGDRVAVIAGDERVGFTELVDRAEAVARELVARGLPPGAFVGVVADRSLASVVAVLGVWLARCAYVPLDPAAPVERRRRVLTDAGADLVLGPPGTDTAPAPQWDPRQAAPCPSAERLRRRTAPDDVAYAIHTSGTTGVPKGSLTSHDNLAHLRAGLGAAVGVTDWSSEIVTLNGPLTFDVALQQLLPLLDGATVLVVPDEVRLVPDAMIALLARHAVTLLDVTPSHLRLLLDAGLVARRPPTLRTVLVGGEPLPSAAWLELGDVAGLRVVNCYGPTETTVDATVAAVDATAERPTIGAPLPGVSLWVADEHGRPVPRGAIGELHIGGDGVGPGYLDRPELTAERFVEAPWGPGGEPVRVYRTGDRVRVARGGLIEYLGRLDDQAKIRGHRVEPGEVTAALLTHPGVTAADTIVHDGAPHGPELRSFAVTGDDAPPGEAVLTRHLRTTLPAHLVPARLVVLDALPVTPSGKVDREALARVVPATPVGTTSSTARPIGPAERRLTALWSEVLGVEVTDPHADFFALGGHSLLAARLLARVRAEFGPEATFPALLGAPTPHRLAARLGARRGAREEHRHLIELRRAADLDVPPVFCLHPVGGDALVYRDLAAALPGGPAVYGVFDGRTDPRARTTWRDAAEMVETYADEIATATGGAGCRLVGWSLGGWIAHAVAGVLEGRGVPVTSIGLWDVGVPDRATPRPASPSWGVGALAVLEALTPASADRLTGDQSDRVLDAFAGEPGPDLGEKILATAAALWGARPDARPVAVADRAVACALHRWLFSGWRPSVVDAPLSVVRASRTLARGEVGTGGWRRHTRGTVHETEVDGTHYSIVEPPTVATLATALFDVERPAHADGEDHG